MVMMTRSDLANHKSVSHYLEGPWLGLIDCFRDPNRSGLWWRRSVGRVRHGHRRTVKKSGHELSPRGTNEGQQVRQLRWGGVQLLAPLSNVTPRKPIPHIFARTEGRVSC
jgi:hypothetical protein